MTLVKQKTFEFDGNFARMFEDFCRDNLLVEKRVAAVAILNYMHADAAERDRMVQQLNAWLDQNAEKTPQRPRIAAKKARGKS